MAGEPNIAFDYTGGWTCAFCGAFVRDGMYHPCVGSDSTPVAPMVMNRDDEIVVLLKRIVELLEKE